MRMKKTLVAVVIVMGLIFIAGNAIASRYLFSGELLASAGLEYEKMKKTPKSKTMNSTSDNPWTYMAYIAAIFDTSQDIFVFPKDIDLRQLADVVSKYLHNHPEEWDERASNLVIRAFRNAYPVAP